MVTDRIRTGLPAILAAAALLIAGILQAQGDSPHSGSYLGVVLVNIDGDRASALKFDEARGVEVKTVVENSPAQAAGLQVGDVLLAYNGEEILSAQQLGRLVSETPSGRKVKLQYLRDGKTRSTVVAPAHYEMQGPDQGAPFSTVPDFPRMLIVWDNLALGIECEPIDSQLAQYFGVSNGILIREVGRGAAGDKAGLKAGDIITDIDTRTVASPRDLISYLRTQRAPGKAMVIKIVRDRKPRTLAVGPNE